MTQTNSIKRFASGVVKAAASKPAAPAKRFAFKRPMALAIEQLLVNQLVEKMHVTDAPPREPDGGYIRIVQRMNYQRDMNVVRLAMESAPVDDSAAMMRRMAWLAGRQAGKTDLGIISTRALVEDGEVLPSDAATA